jgi:glycosyltransferase involved in cell wall biosynthesis
MHDTSVSIIINNYNYERFIAAAIDSALGQTHPRVEVIVVDDGSRDGSRDVIARYGDRITPVFQENGGQGAALNSGFARSHGEVVLFLDADDVLLPNAVERVLDVWQRDTTKVQFRLQFMDAQGAIIEGSHPHPAHTMTSGDLTAEIVQWGDYIFSPTSGNAFSREMLAEILPMPTEPWRISADVYLVYLAPFYGKVVSIDEVLGHYRVHGQNHWAHDKPVLSRLSSTLQTDQQKEAVILRGAARAGIPARPGLIWNSPWHVYLRITHAALDPAPSPGAPTVRRLVWRAMRATWRYPRMTLRLKLVATLWLIVLAVLPRAAAARVAVWRTYPAERPSLLRSLRRLTG